MPLRIVTWNVNGIRNPFKYSPWNQDKTLQGMFDTLEADIVCFQEVKTPKAGLTDDLVFIDGWDAFYSFPQSQTGYSGVAVYTRDRKCAPTRVEEGVTGVLKVPGTKSRYVDQPAAGQIGGYPTERQLQRAGLGRDVIDSEGRCLLLDFPLFVLINVYCPARRNEERTGFRDAFFTALDARVRNLAAAGRNVVLCGDMNTMCGHLDTAAVWGHAGQLLAAEALLFDQDCRTLRAAQLFNGMVFGRDAGRDRDGQVDHDGHDDEDDDNHDDDNHDDNNHDDNNHDDNKDDNHDDYDDHNDDHDHDDDHDSPPLLHDACRELHPRRTGMYTCWDTRKNHRPANFGSRIDFVLCSPVLMRQLVQAADIQPALLGSDHCPVYVVLRDSIPAADGQTLYTVDYLNPPGRFLHGQPAQTPPGQQDTAAPVPKRLPQSARRMAPFGNRQHIASLFARRPTSATVATETGGKPQRDTSTQPSQSDEPLLPLLLRANRALLHGAESSAKEAGELQAGTLLSNDAVSAAAATPAASQARVASPVVQEPTAGYTISRQPDACPDAAKPLSPPGPPGPPGPHRAQTALARTPSLLQQLQAQAKPVSPKKSGTRAASASGASTPTRVAKKPKTAVQTSISLFLQPKKQKRAGPIGPDDPGPTDTAAPEAETAAHAESPTDQPGQPDQPDIAADGFWAEVNDAAVAGWSALGLGQRQAPLCEHGEPCKTYVTRKPGVNSGRSFYMCARPPGPLGRREKGTPWQCTTFVWCRDWRREKEDGQEDRTGAT